MTDCVVRIHVVESDFDSAIVVETTEPGDGTVPCPEPATKLLTVDTPHGRHTGAVCDTHAIKMSVYEPEWRNGAHIVSVVPIVESVPR